MLGQQLHVEEPDIITVSIRPGMVDTAMQAYIRSDESRDIMSDSDRERFRKHHEQGALISPEVSGRVLSALALYAGRDLSGRFVNWDDPDMTELQQKLTQ